MKLALFGNGGHAREVASQIDKEITFFVDDKFSDSIVKPISKFNPNEYMIMIAVADSQKRAEIVNRLPINTKFFSFVHPSVIILDKNISIGVGSFIGANSILTTNIIMGNHSILVRGNQIGHDCVIGDYFSMMPGAILSGNVVLNDQVFMGTNSSIVEKTTVSNNVIIGLNSGVISDIKLPGTYVGTPARIINT